MERITIDLSQAHFWDITSVAALDKVVIKFRRKRRSHHSWHECCHQTVVDKFGIHNDPDEVEKLMGVTDLATTKSTLSPASTVPPDLWRCAKRAWVAARLERSLLLLHTWNDASSTGLMTEWSDWLGPKRIAGAHGTAGPERGKLALQYGKTLLAEAEQRVKDRGLQQVQTLLRHGDLWKHWRNLKPRPG